MFTIIFTIVTILIIWFKTDFFLEFAALFDLDSDLGADKYRKRNSFIQSDFSYPEFLAVEYPDSFFIKLISCEYCLGLWLSLIGSFFIGIVYVPTIYVASLMIYFLLCAIKKNV